MKELVELLNGLPDDTILMRTMSGNVFTVKDAKIESENAKLYFNSILRVARDILRSQANKQ